MAGGGRDHQGQGASLSEFALKPIRGENQTACSELLRNGAPTGTVAPGVVLEKQVRLGSESLILTTEDCPYEEMLHVLLIDGEWRIIDRWSLGAAYQPGILSRFRMIEPDAIEFSFFGNDVWRVRVRERRGRSRLEVRRLA